MAATNFSEQKHVVILRPEETGITAQHHAVVIDMLTNKYKLYHTAFSDKYADHQQDTTIFPEKSTLS
jgi:hypothetical protein